MAGINGSPEEILRRSPCASLEENLDCLRAVFRMPQNKDIVLHRFPVCGFGACAAFIDGISSSDEIAASVIRPCVTEKAPDENLKSEDRLRHIGESILYACQVSEADTFADVARDMLNGLCALFADGCAGALLIDTRDLPHRAVSHTNNESVVLGSQEGFVESLRTNISLVRKHLHSPALVTEMIPVGSKNRLNAALLYVDGVTDPKIVAEARRRLRSVSLANVSGTGQIQQLIEDYPFSLFPQLLQTERPDRTAAGLAEGQFAILADNSPYALLAPSTLFHFIHASDDTFMRWQYGTFIRVIRSLGILLSLFLPGLYIALTQFHTHLLPMNLLTSIAEARSNVPFPVIGEILVMEFSFFLINEAGTRIPSQIGSTVSIVGALVLGQAAVSASIISPILVILVAITGLGNYAAPNYGFGLSIVLYRVLFVLAGAALGLYGVLLMLVALSVRLCGIHSFGVPYLAPVAPKRPHGPDILLRLSLRRQQHPMYYAQRGSWMKGKRSK